MIPEQRQQELLRRLRDAGVLSTRELTDALGVSHMTVRRDIAALEAAGEATAVQGGVRLPERAKEPPRERAARSSMEVPSKNAIARRAATFVEDDMVVFLDAGTTCEAVVANLTGRTGVTVVTNDFHTVESLASHREVDVIHTGGAVDRTHSSATGPLAAATVRRLGIDLYLMSTGTWDIKHGVTVPDADAAILKTAALEAAARTVLLADSTKFGAFTRHRVVPLDALDLVLTDARLATEDQDALQAAGVRLELARPPE